MFFRLKQKFYFRVAVRRLQRFCEDYQIPLAYSEILELAEQLRDSLMREGIKGLLFKEWGDSPENTKKDEKDEENEK